MRDVLPDLSGWVEDKGGFTVALHTASPIMAFVDGKASPNITKSFATDTLDPASWGPALETLDLVLKNEIDLRAELFDFSILRSGEPLPTRSFVAALALPPPSACPQSRLPGQSAVILYEGRAA